MTARCPLCEEDIQVGTAGPQGLEQHRGKKKCLANFKKKQQDAQAAKNPTLFSYLRRRDSTLSTATDLAREVERNEIESSSRVVVSHGTTAQAISGTHTSHTDQDGQSQGEDADLSADRDLESDLKLDLDHAWDRDKSPAWSAVKVRVEVGRCEPRNESRARSTTPIRVQKSTQNEDRTLCEDEDTQNLA